MLPHHHRNLRVALDEGRFSLRSGDDGDLDVSLVVDRALEGEHIAQEGPVLVVITPHQTNLAMGLCLEVFGEAPVDDLGEWQQVFEAHVDVGPEGSWYESFIPPDIRLDVPPGSYHAQIAGRGLVTYGWAGTTEPGDEWRIRLWPSAGPERARCVKRWAVEGTAPDGTPTG